MVTNPDPYPTAPTLPGYAFRHALMPADLAQMNDVANAARAAEGEGWFTSLDQFRNYYENLSNCDPQTDIVVAERDGLIVGYGRASWREEIDGPRLYDVTAFAHPDHAGRLLDGLIEATEGRCRQVAAGHPPGEKLLESEAADEATSRLGVLARRGYRPVRYSFLMVRPNLDDLADAPLPAGLEIRPVKPEHLRAIFDAEVEALRDHWGASLQTEEDFQLFATNPVESDTSMWRVAWDNDQVAGMVRGYIRVDENAQYGRQRGWVENISVRRPWRRRGLARALIGATISALREAGMTEGALGVDAENPTGALRLYLSCGFVVSKRDATYRKPLDGPDG